MAKAANFDEESEWLRVVQGRSSNDPKSNPLTDRSFDWDPNAEVPAGYPGLVDEYLDPSCYSDAFADITGDQPQIVPWSPNATYCQDTTLADQFVGRFEDPITSVKIPSAQYIGDIARGQPRFASSQAAFASEDTMSDERSFQRLQSPATLPEVTGTDLRQRVNELEFELENTKSKVDKLNRYLHELAPWVEETHVMTDHMWQWERFVESTWSSAADSNDTVPVNPPVQEGQQLVRNSRSG